MGIMLPCMVTLIPLLLQGVISMKIAGALPGIWKKLAVAGKYMKE